MGPFQFGPLLEGNVILLADINNMNYVLKAESTKYSLYFGPNIGDNNFISFQLKWENGQYLLSTENFSLVVQLQGVYFSSVSSAAIKYFYNDKMTEQNTALYADNDCTLRDANGLIMNFPYKSAAQQERDLKLQNDPLYVPQYQGFTNRIKIIAQNSYYDTNCNVSGYLTAYLAYAGFVEYQSKYSTVPAICKNKAYYLLCDVNSTLCKSNCYGSCDNNNEVCTIKGKNLNCINRNAVNQEGTDLQLIKLVSGLLGAFLLLVILVVSIYIYQRNKKKGDVKND